MQLRHQAHIGACGLTERCQDHDENALDSTPLAGIRMTGPGATAATQAMSKARWLPLAWYGMGLLSLVVSFQLEFALSTPTELAAGLGSIGIALFTSFSRAWLDALRAQLTATKRKAIFLMMPILLASMCWANLYVALFALHIALAEPGQIVVTLSTKSEASPYRKSWTTCKQYVRFREFAGYPGGRFCLPRQTYEKVQGGERFPARSLESPLGYSIERVEFPA